MKFFETPAFYKKLQVIKTRRKSCSLKSGKHDDVLAQTDTDELVAARRMTIDVKCYTTEIRPIICRCTEVRRGRVTAPIVALLVTVAVEPGNKEAGVKRIIADEQLVCVSVDYLHVVPQSISTSRVAIVTGGCYWLVRSSLKIELVSSLVILEDNFFELQKYER